MTLCGSGDLYLALGLPLLARRVPNSLLVCVLAECEMGSIHDEAPVPLCAVALPLDLYSITIIPLLPQRSCQIEASSSGHPALRYPRDRKREGFAPSLVSHPIPKQRPLPVSTD
jgi:hypothetical protein